jgi:hypothetical protein
VNQLERELIESSKSRSFLKTIHRAILDQNSETGDVTRAIVSIHNQGHLNCISEFLNLKKETLGMHFFWHLKIIKAALPRMNASAEEILSCIQHLVKETGNDAAVLRWYDPFMKYCELNFDRVQEALNLAKNPEKEYQNFIPAIILAGTKQDLSHYAEIAIQLANDENHEIKCQAIFTLGNINYLSNEELLSSVFKLIDSIIKNNSNDQILAISLKSAYSLYTSNNTFESALINIIDESIAKGNVLVFHAMSEIFALTPMPASEEVLTLLVSSQKILNIENKDTLENITRGLIRLIRDDNKKSATDLIEKLLLQSEVKLSIKQFDGLAYEIYNDSRGYLNYLITRWFLSKKSTLCRAARDLMYEIHDHDLELKVDTEQIINIDPESHIFIARKAIGWLFVKPIYATSFICTILHDTNDSNATLIADLLFDPLLLSYPDTVKKNLMERLSNHQPREKKLIQHQIHKLDKYMKNLMSVSNVPEMRAPSSERDEFLRLFNKIATDSFNEEQKKSIINRIAKKQILLYGNSTINHTYTNEGTKRKEEKLKTYTNSLEASRLSIIEPTGTDFLLQAFRNEGCTQ